MVQLVGCRLAATADPQREEWRAWGWLDFESTILLM